MDLDLEIARLEAELQKESSNESSCESDDDDDDDDDEDEHVFKTKLSEEDAIPALPSSLLPSIAVKKISSITSEKKKKGPKSTEPKPTPVPVIPKAVKQQELMNYIRGYTPSEHKPFFCRLCNFQGTSVEDLGAHRQTSAHQANSVKDQKACFCRLCRKQFTSPAQLTEHLKGKGHTDTLLRRSDPAAFREQKEQERMQRDNDGTSRKRPRHGEEERDGEPLAVKVPDEAAELREKVAIEESRERARNASMGNFVKREKKVRERTKLRKDLERTVTRKDAREGGKSKARSAIENNDKDDDETVFRSEDGPFDEDGDIDDIFGAL